MSRVLLVASALIAAVLVGVSPRPVMAATGSNPVVTENALPGSTGWQIPSSGNTVADDAANQIKGYASATSVNLGESIGFNVTVNPAQTFTIDVYRLGYYGGAGGRKITTIGPVNGSPQPGCPMDATTGMVECRWSQSASLSVPADWVSGIYLGVMTNAEHFQNYITFTVRDDARASDLLLQQSVSTYEAYNNYPYTKSLYEFNSDGGNTVSGTKRAVKVSFDRPYKDNGAADVLLYEANFIGWMEKAGYDVTYATDVDIHANPARLMSHKGLLSVGHDEYWSKEMFDGWSAARDSGRNLGFFGANAAYWQVRFESSSSGVANRVMVCYKSAALDPVKGATATDQFRNLGRPEQQLIGVQQSATESGSFPYVVQNSSTWIYAGTGFNNGDTVIGVVGGETDRFFPEFPAPVGTQTFVAKSPVTTTGGFPESSSASVYQAPSGAWVFGAGTFRWSWGLSSVPFHAPSRDGTDQGGIPDSRFQRTTQNILDRFVGSSSVPVPKSGYWMLGSDGRVYGFGDAHSLGDAHPAVGHGAIRIVPTADYGGYWIVDDVGTVSTFGDAAGFGSLASGTLHTRESVTSISVTKSGRGYWLFTTEGRVFPFGDATVFGDLSGKPLNGPVLDSIPTLSGRGYYMVASDGGIFAFGDAVFLGSMGGRPLNKPVQSLVPTAIGSGYWLVASDGGIFAFGNAPFLGSMGGKPLNKPIVGMVRFGNGYLMVASDGGIFNFSDRPFLGSLGANPPLHPITAVAPLV